VYDTADPVVVDATAAGMLLPALNAAVTVAVLLTSGVTVELDGVAAAVAIVNPADEATGTTVAAGEREVVATAAALANVHVVVRVNSGSLTTTVEPPAGKISGKAVTEPGRFDNDAVPGKPAGRAVGLMYPWTPDAVIDCAWQVALALAWVRRKSHVSPRNAGSALTKAAAGLMMVSGALTGERSLAGQSS